MNTEATTTNTTRATLKGQTISWFDGRKKVGTSEHPSVTEALIGGILAALTFPTTIEEAIPAVEAAISEALIRKGSVIPDSYRHQYGVDQNCGDAMAAELKDYCGGGLNDPLDINRLETVASANSISDRFDTWMDKGLNPGMVRMNVGNVLRGMLRRGEAVVIGDRKFNVEQAD